MIHVPLASKLCLTDGRPTVHTAARCATTRALRCKQVHEERFSRYYDKCPLSPSVCFQLIFISKSTRTSNGQKRIWRAVRCAAAFMSNMTEWECANLSNYFFFSFFLRVRLHACFDGGWESAQQSAWPFEEPDYLMACDALNTCEILPPVSARRQHYEV